MEKWERQAKRDGGIRERLTKTRLVQYMRSDTASDICGENLRYGHSRHPDTSNTNEMEHYSQLAMVQNLLPDVIPAVAHGPGDSPSDGVFLCNYDHDSAHRRKSATGQ